MIPAGDTTSIQVKEWAHVQAAFLGGNHLTLLLVLTHFAFYRAKNPEDAPVGQVMEAYSTLQKLAAWTHSHPRTIERTLWSLQAEHGYLTRLPRPADGRAGKMPRIIQIYWTHEDDVLRDLYRKGKAPLPDEFVVTAEQVENRNRVPDLRLYRNDDEVEQL